MINHIMRIRRPLSVLFHAVLAAVATYVAFLLRFDSNIPPAYQQTLNGTLLWIVLIRLVVFAPFKLFEGLWKYASLWDLRNIVLAVTASSVAIWTADVVLQWGHPRSIHFISAFVLICLVGGARMARRVYRELASEPSRSRRVIIYGAGDAGEMIVRDMKLNRAYNAAPVGFIDDDVHKVGRRIHGVPVLGTSTRIAAIMEAFSPDELLIAIPSASPRAMRALVRAVEPYKVRITTLPGLHEIVNGDVHVSQIRPLQVEDLLARAPVGLNPEPLQRLLCGRRVMVTGAGGSIGSELCRQIAMHSPASLVLFERYENSLYSIYHALDDASPGFAVHAVIGDVTDCARLDAVFAEHRPEIVFHAAAHKHVPLMEFNPCEAVKNNVGGSRLVAEAADRYGVERFILISTDKAVNPTSVMGATKRIAELAIRGIAENSRTAFVTVRFGNVLGSNGSVIPRFLKQIETGGPVTVTDPDVRRFFMLIPEAVNLVLHAATLAEHGECVYVLDMGEQLRLLDMARNVIRLSGYVPEDEIEITFVGLRPGEKLFEELVGDDEVSEASPVDKIMRVRPTRHFAFDRQMASAIEALERNAQIGDVEVVIRQLCTILPNFTPTTHTVAVA